MDSEIDLDKRHEEYLKSIKRFVLMDDTFMSKVFEDKSCAELLLSVILNRNDLKVQRVVSQQYVKNLQGRSVQLDIYAVDNENKQYNIEVQRNDEGAVPERARYNSSLMDANLTDPGDKFKDLPETYVIFITEHDVLKGGKPLYTIERTIAELGSVSFGDRSHIIYVNGECRDTTALGRLMQDFFCAEPQKMNYSILADRVHYFKEEQEGQSNMCKIMEELIEEETKKVAKRTALMLISSGKMTLEEISEITGLSVDELKDLSAEHTA